MIYTLYLSNFALFGHGQKRSPNLLKINMFLKLKTDIFILLVAESILFAIITSAINYFVYTPKSCTASNLNS